MDNHPYGQLFKTKLSICKLKYVSNTGSVRLIVSPSLFMLDALSASIETDGTTWMDIVPLFPFRPVLMMDKISQLQM